MSADNLINNYSMYNTIPINSDYVFLTTDKSKIFKWNKVPNYSRLVKIILISYYILKTCCYFKQTGIIDNQFCYVDIYFTENLNRSIARVLAYYFTKVMCNVDK